MVFSKFLIGVSCYIYIFNVVKRLGAYKRWIKNRMFRVKVAEAEISGLLDNCSMVQGPHMLEPTFSTMQRYLPGKLHATSLYLRLCDIVFKPKLR